MATKMATMRECEELRPLGIVGQYRTRKLFTWGVQGRAHFAGSAGPSHEESPRGLSSSFEVIQNLPPILGGEVGESAVLQVDIALVRGPGLVDPIFTLTTEYDFDSVD